MRYTFVTAGTPRLDRAVLTGLYWRTVLDGYAPDNHELGKMLGVSHATVHYVICRLARQKMLRRGPARSHRSVTLTTKGKRIASMVSIDLETAQAIAEKWRAK